MNIHVSTSSIFEQFITLKFIVQFFLWDFRGGWGGSQWWYRSLKNTCIKYDTVGVKGLSSMICIYSIIPCSMSVDMNGYWVCAVVFDTQYGKIACVSFFSSIKQIIPMSLGCISRCTEAKPSLRQEGETSHKLLLHSRMFPHMQGDTQTDKCSQTDRFAQAEPRTFSANSNTQTATLTHPLSEYNLTPILLHCSSDGSPGLMSVYTHCIPCTY